MFSLLRRTAVVLGLSTLALGSASCELVGDTTDILAVRVPVTYTLPVTIPVAYPGNERLSELQANGETSVPILSYIPVDLGTVDDQLTNANLVEEVIIEAVTMEVVSNTLEEVTIQPFEIRVGEPGTEILGAEVAGSDWDSALVVGATPSIQPATPPFTGSIPAEMNTANQLAAAQRIANLEFGFGMGTELTIPSGELPSSSGRADVRFTLQLVFVVDPL